MFYSQIGYPNVGQLFAVLEKSYDNITNYLNGLTRAQLNALSRGVSRTKSAENNGVVFCLESPIHYDPQFQSHLETMWEPDKRQFRIIEECEDITERTSECEILSASVSKGSFHMKCMKPIDGQFYKCSLDIVTTTGTVAQRGVDVQCVGRCIGDGSKVVGGVEGMSIMFDWLSTDLNAFVAEIGMVGRMILPDIPKTFAERVAGMTNPYRGR